MVFLSSSNGSPEGQAFGWSMLAMGTAATLYHSASGKLRSVLRKVDYYTISLSCMAMANSLRSQEGSAKRAVQTASLAALPFKPTAVTAYHAAHMEVRCTYFYRRAQTDWCCSCSTTENCCSNIPRKY